MRGKYGRRTSCSERLVDNMEPRDLTNQLAKLTNIEVQDLPSKFIVTQAVKKSPAFKNRNVCYRVYNTVPLKSILSQFNQVLTFKPWSSEIDFNVILSFLPRLLYFGFPTKILSTSLIFPNRAICPALECLLCNTGLAEFYVCVCVVVIHLHLLSYVFLVIL
jgi:hypothetical protein